MSTFFLKFIKSDQQTKYMIFVDRNNMTYKIPYNEFNSNKKWVEYRKVYNLTNCLEPGNFLKLNQEKFFIKYDEDDLSYITEGAETEGAEIKLQKVQFVELKECTFLRIINKNGELKHDFT